MNRVTAPAISNFGTPTPFPHSRIIRASRNASAPTGRRIQKIALQSNISTSIPPISGPQASPTPADPLISPIASPRSLAGNAATRVATELAIIAAEPIPAKALYPINW